MSTNRTQINKSAIIAKVASAKGDLLLSTKYGKVNAQIKKVSDIFNWMDQNGGKPPKGQFNPMSQYLSNLRSGYNGNGSTKPYSETIKYIKTSKYPYILSNNDLMSNQLRAVRELFDWMNTNNGNKPRVNSIDSVESKLYSKLNNLRVSSLNDGIYNETIEFIKQSRYPHILIPINRIDIQLEKIINLINWIDIHNGITPSASSKDKMEKSLGQFIASVKQGYKNGTLHKESLTLIKKSKYHKLFTFFNIQDIHITQLNNIFKWMDLHCGNTPSYTSVDKNERLLCGNLIRLRKFYSTNKIHPLVFRYIKKSTYPTILISTHSDIYKTKILNSILDYLNKHNGNLPPNKSTLSNYLHTFRRLYKTHKLTPPLVTLINKSNYYMLFQPIDRINNQLDMTMHLIKWINKYNGTYPHKNSICATESKLASYFYDLRRRYKDPVTRGVLYPETIKLLKSNKMMHILT